MTSTFTSKHFEQNTALLRREVSRYLERGICITDNNFDAPSVLVSSNLLYTLCKEIAKARGTLFVAVNFHKDREAATVAMPATVKAKPLWAQAMMIGVPYKRGEFGLHPVAYDRKTSGLHVYYAKEKGMEILKTWLHMCETDNAMRFALGLPPKVSRDPSR